MRYLVGKKENPHQHPKAMESSLFFSFRYFLFPFFYSSKCSVDVIIFIRREITSFFVLDQCLRRQHCMLHFTYLRGSQTRNYFAPLHPVSNIFYRQRSFLIKTESKSFIHRNIDIIEIQSSENQKINLLKSAKENSITFLLEKKKKNFQNSIRVKIHLNQQLLPLFSNKSRWDEFFAFYFFIFD